MKIGKNGMTVLEKRYLKKDDEGKPIETVEEMLHRVADTIAAADVTYDPKADIAGTAARFYQLMSSLDFLPNSPTLMNAGRDLGQLSACFVLPVGDSMEEIFEAVKQAALIHKSGGGTGFSFSRLRQTGSTVRTTGGVASGPVSFMRVFNMATEAVKQGGTRRGANMGILRIDHPDILQFIDCKKDNADITNFNISVGVTEVFMQAVEQGARYDLIDPKTKAAVGQLDAKEVFAKIVEAAWHNGEPGIIFLDRLNRDNVVPGQGEIESTNPCGEQPLLPYESCNLGSINLVNMLKKDKSGYLLDYQKLDCTIADAVHFLDNVIEVNRYPLEIISKTTRATRKIGLGVMGYADMLLRLGLGYNTPEAVALAGELMERVTRVGREASQKLAETRGAFPLFAESIYKDGPALRNATITTIAPTGTLSIIAGCSSGVEPVFAYAYVRNIMDGTEMIETNPILEEVLRERGLYSDALMRRIVAEGSLAHITELPEDIRRVFVCSHDISPAYHINTQAAFQHFTDNAVSKTVNFTHDA
ncbi:MAG: adenosylcobalamin-dependent ribonucleoside-diphosphate reductase, partial [Angelakisella sp.]